MQGNLKSKNVLLGRGRGYRLLGSPLYDRLLSSGHKRNIGVGQEWQDTIPEMVPQHPCYQQMKPRHLGLISSLT